jgi:hypothetical protein
MAAGRTDEMRAAVAAGDWPAVLRLWDRYAAGILDEIARGTCTTARMAEAREFLEWARRVVVCARARSQKQLDAIHAARQYDREPSARASGIRESF